MTIGDRIRHIRRSAGLRQCDVARAVGVRRETVANWEAGRNEPRKQNRDALMGALGVTEAEFYTYAPEVD
jgi:transcriptional regulator with XRE-family HTH domain